MHSPRTTWSKLPAALVAAIISVAVVPLGHLVLHIAAEWPLVISCVSLIILAMILYLLIHIAQKLESIHDHGRLQVRFLPCDSPDSIRDAYRYVKNVVESSPEGDGTHIMALNSFLEAIQEPPDQANEARLAYYDALITKNANYTRILQLHRELGGNLYDKIQPGYGAHYQQMIEKSSKRCFTDARLAEAQYPFSFVLIDIDGGGSHLFWQIDEHTPENLANSETFRVSGYIVISDPDRVITREFRHLFRKVEKAKGTRPLVPENFRQDDGTDK